MARASVLGLASWWTLFRSPALNVLVQQSLNNNPSLQTAMANLRAARQRVYAQEGKFFPTVDLNFNPTNQLTPSVLTPLLNSASNPFTLYTAQVVHFRCLGSQPTHR